MRGKQYISAVSTLDETSGFYSLYKELLSLEWRVDSFQIYPLTEKWKEMDIDQRIDINSNLIIAKIMMDLIGSQILPRVLATVSEGDMAQKAAVSEVMTVLNGRHNRAISKIINRLNTADVLQLSLESASSKDGLLNSISMLQTYSDGISTWIQVEKGKEYSLAPPKINQSLSKVIWEGLSLSVIVIEAYMTTAVSLLAIKDEEYKDISVILRLILRDLSVMSEILSMSAEERYYSFDSALREKENHWIESAAKHIFNELWSASSFESEYRVQELVTMRFYGEYNVNKALIRLGQNRVFESTEMPQEIKTFLKVPEVKNREEKAVLFSWLRGQ